MRELYIGSPWIVKVEPRATRVLPHQYRLMQSPRSRRSVVAQDSLVEKYNLPRKLPPHLQVLQDKFEAKKQEVHTCQAAARIVFRPLLTGRSESFLAMVRS